MNLQSIDKIKLKFQNKSINPKQSCDWDNFQQVDKLMMILKQMQVSLEQQMSQSIQSHLLGKQRAINILQQVLPYLQKQKIRAKQPQPQLINLIQIVEIKSKIDFCLAKLDSMLSNNQD